MGRKTHLDYDFHEVFLGNNILALDDLLENGREDGILVELQIDAVKLREANEICADQNTKIFTFGLALLAVARVTLVLKAHPELIHFDEISELEGDGILQISRRPAMVTVRSYIKVKEVTRTQCLSQLASGRASGHSDNVEGRDHGWDGGHRATFPSCPS
jgi:hypothetical protein